LALADHFALREGAANTHAIGCWLTLPQCQSGHGGEEKNSCPCQKANLIA